LGLLVIFVLSFATDQVLHMLEVYPPWGQPMYDKNDNLLALAYRIVYAVVGCYIAARLAPRNPMRHALALGVIGVVLSLAGAITAIKMDMGPAWYPIALVLTALPCAWLGGVLYRKGRPVAD
jgi:surface polysaccharide O-acyltransferase-like enzyme